MRMMTLWDWERENKEKEESVEIDLFEFFFDNFKEYFMSFKRWIPRKVRVKKVENKNEMREILNDSVESRNFKGLRYWWRLKNNPFNKKKEVELIGMEMENKGNKEIYKVI